MAELVASDTGSTLYVYCTDAGTGEALDLTGSTVRLKYRIDGGTLQTKTMQIESPQTTGIVYYTFLTGELVAGTLEAEVEITAGASTVLTSIPTFSLEIREKL